LKHDAAAHPTSPLAIAGSAPPLWQWLKVSALTECPTRDGGDLERPSSLAAPPCFGVRRGGYHIHATKEDEDGRETV
jgi:hypothetical protein